MQDSIPLDNCFTHFWKENVSISDVILIDVVGNKFHVGISQTSNGLLSILKSYKWDVYGNAYCAHALGGDTCPPVVNRIRIL